MNRRIYALSLILTLLVTTSSFAVVQQRTYDESGTASGLTSCTTANSCLQCGHDVTNGNSVCAAVSSNGSCSCTLNADGCTSKGTCTYRP